ncbi:hypothetical protein NA57DRAFT_74457 [Rhizodiscina lignyota]|uniref:Uncharacterized protein n=1 Tax=Rhizodiscina lignyota TaxID=1504668 RepID=A0A9P4M7U5_9PEZI|nr:hypothetical protein NA57DRAFT_74457 [Rhizodiscina lignyota]
MTGTFLRFCPTRQNASNPSPKSRLHRIPLSNLSFRSDLLSFDIPEALPSTGSIQNLISLSSFPAEGGAVATVKTVIDFEPDNPFEANRSNPHGSPGRLKNARHFSPAPLRIETDDTNGKDGTRNGGVIDAYTLPTHAVPSLYSHGFTPGLLHRMAFMALRRMGSPTATVPDIGPTRLNRFDKTLSTLEELQKQLETIASVRVLKSTTLRSALCHPSTEEISTSGSKSSANVLSTVDADLDPGLHSIESDGCTQMAQRIERVPTHPGEQECLPRLHISGQCAHPFSLSSRGSSLGFLSEVCRFPGTDFLLSSFLSTEVGRFTWSNLDPFCPAPPVSFMALAPDAPDPITSDEGEDL